MTHDVGAVAPLTSTDMETDHSDSIPAQEERGQTGEHSYRKDTTHAESGAPCSNKARQATVKKLTEECTILRAEVYRLRDKVGKLCFNQGAFKDDDMVQDLTGLSSYAKLIIVFTFLSGFLKVGPGLSPFHSFYPNESEVRSFLGLASYYRRFITGFANIARPLHQLTKKGQRFMWSPASQDAFTYARLSSPLPS
ncbi:hypothetical protein AAFF_G00437400 [Aldrovandia affinis]|uniref:Uncharacterized protein n=1 Tax=Aldrovandia affinis TaxID=143900 RepID=A0AAD7S7Q5_9TELE|nr:hypothetical protein AAFF_G00437400 [Aldrovandia affinis]